MKIQPHHRHKMLAEKLREKARDNQLRVSSILLGNITFKYQLEALRPAGRKLFPHKQRGLVLFSMVFQ